MSQRETDSYLIERSLAVIPIQKKDKGGADLSESFKVTAVFKDLQKLVSQQQRENTRKELFSRLQDKPFWIWDREQHKQEDIKTDGDCCFNHIIGLPRKDGNDKPLYEYEQIIFDSLTSKNNNKYLWIKKAPSTVSMLIMPPIAVIVQNIFRSWYSVLSYLDCFLIA